MKKYLSIIMVVIALLGCATNPYTEEDFERGKKPMRSGWGIALGIVPGLPQFINGEILEGCIAAGAFVGGVAIIQATGYEDGTAKPGQEAINSMGSILNLAAISYSMIDGGVSSHKRYDQYLAFYYPARAEYLNKTFTDQEREAIANHSIFIGMSRAALLESWGKPEKINNSAGLWGERDQYVYPEQYVYVEGDKITGWN